jgi:hypothetical protein
VRLHDPLSGGRGRARRDWPGNLRGRSRHTAVPHAERRPSCSSTAKAVSTFWPPQPAPTEADEKASGTVSASTGWSFTAEAEPTVCLGSLCGQNETQHPGAGQRRPSSRGTSRPERSRNRSSWVRNRYGRSRHTVLARCDPERIALWHGVVRNDSTHSRLARPHRPAGVAFPAGVELSRIEGQRRPVHVAVRSLPGLALATLCLRLLAMPRAYTSHYSTHRRTTRGSSTAPAEALPIATLLEK